MSDAHQTPHTHQPPKKTAGAMAISNILAIIGSIILIVIIIWGLIHLFSIAGWFSGNGASNTKIEVSVPAQAVSGQPVHVSWKYSTKEKGSYAFVYPCAEELKLAAPGPNGALFALPCGSAFTLGAATSSITVLPVLTGTSSLSVPVTVLFMPAATGTQAQGTATMKVVAGSGTPIATSTKPSTPKPTTPKPTTPKPVTPTVTGPADLAVVITSISVDQYGNGVVTFNISNIGGATAGTYTFTAQLPTSVPYTYVSAPQSPLSPGSYVVNTLHFSQGIPGNLLITVDPYNAVHESNESNNTALQYLTPGYRY